MALAGVVEMSVFNKIVALPGVVEISIFNKIASFVGFFICITNASY